MNSNIHILALGLDKSHFQEKFEYFQKAHNNVYCYGSWNPIKKELCLSKQPRIDISLLYDKENLFEAFPIKKKAVLDTEFLKAMYECESVFFSTVDRCSIENYRIGATKVYFQDLLLFFKSFFEENTDISHVFFPTTPHFPVDIVLFYVTQYFSKHTVILNRTDFNNKFFFRSDWRKTHDFKHDFTYTSSRLITAKDTTKDSNFVQYSKKLNELSLKSFGKNKWGLSVIVNFLKLLKLSVNNYKNKADISPLHLNNDISWLKIFNALIQRYYENKRLAKLYQSQMQNPSLDVDYLYFPLHFQPERSTTPEGMFFSNQLRAIELLRDSLPVSMAIFVKEHPRQFDSDGNIDLRKIAARNNIFYKTIRNLPNTYLIDIKIDSNLLIKKAKIVSTITGSSGWQGLVLGKPIFIFGRPWYSSFDNCYNITSKEDILAAMATIKNVDFKVDKQDIADFIASLKDKLFEAYIGSMFYDDKLDYSTIIASFSTNLMTYLNNLDNHQLSE